MYFCLILLYFILLQVLSGDITEDIVFFVESCQKWHWKKHRSYLMNQEEVAISNPFNHTYHIGGYNLCRCYYANDRFYTYRIYIFWWLYIYFCYDSFYDMSSYGYFYEISSIKSIIPYLRYKVYIGMF